MKRLSIIAMIFGILLGVSPFLAAEEPPAPSPPSVSPAPRPHPPTNPMVPSPMLGLMSAMSKSAPANAAQEQPLYPMFQMLGPSMTGNPGLTPETMGTLMTMQGEMMIKMGEILMKYGQMLSGKTN